MEVVARFKSGISAASYCFYMLWHNKPLLSYFGIVTAIKIALTLFSTSYTLQKYSGSLSVTIINIPLQIAIVTLAVWAQVALTQHASYIFDEQQVGIKKIITSSANKWPLILTWGLITFFVTAFFSRLSAIQSAQPLEMSFGLMGLAWALLTIFIPTSIALENLSPIDHVLHAIVVLRNYLFKLFGGLFWIGIIFVLCMAPFSLAHLVAYLSPNLYYNITFLQAASCLELAVQWGISSACTLFKASLYFQYKRNIDELQQLSYPKI